MKSEYHLLSKEETYSLIIASQSGDKSAKEKLIKANAGLVNSIAGKYTSTNYEYEDLQQLGYIGLIKAIDGFDTGFDVMFSTYAVPMIAGEIRRFLRDDGRVKVSRKMKKAVSDMKKTREELEHKAGRSIRISELAQAMGLGKEEIVELLEAESAMQSLDSIDDENKKEISEVKSVEDFENARVEMIDLKNVIGTLQEKDRQVMVLRYFKDMTQQQTGDMLGISQVQVSRIEKRVLSYLRKEISGG